MIEEIVGPVVAVTEKGETKSIVVRDEKNEYGRHLACDFWKDKRQAIEGVRVGDHVKVKGESKSREGKDKWQGVWFTNFNAFACQKAAGASVPDSKEGPADDDVNW